MDVANLSQNEPGEADFKTISWLEPTHGELHRERSLSPLLKGRPHMNLKVELTAFRNQSRDLPQIDKALLSCRFAKQLEKSGEYEAALEVLSEFWPNQDTTVRLEGLDDSTKGELLLRVGALAGWLASFHQTRDGQEIAKDLITTAIEVFEAVDRSDRVAEARGDLALCYWREGSYDEARIQLGTALKIVPESNRELKAILLIRAGIVEVYSERLTEASRLYNEAAPLLDTTDDEGLKGAYHDELAVLFTKLSEGLNSQAYLDRALIEYAAASFHFEQAGNTRYRAKVENNLGYLLFKAGRFNEAHLHLDRARILFLEIGDAGSAASTDETRARTLLSEGDAIQAERVVRAAGRTLQKGSEQGLLAEALTTHGTSLARLGSDDRARATFDRAIEVALTAGDLDGAGLAKLSVIEELGKRLPIKELISIYRDATDLLRKSQAPAIGNRLVTCAEQLFELVERLEAEPPTMPDTSWEGFSLKRYIREGERAVIERALREAGGSVTRASKLLGFKHHQSLISLLNGRHKDLLDTRSKVRKRRRPVVAQRKKEQSANTRSDNRPLSTISILHVEDNRGVANVVRETLMADGMQVDLCSTGTAALEILKGENPYDVLILDNKLPGLNGLELVVRVRTMAHRRNMRIIMLSDDEIEKEAWRAGAHEFLRKPQEIERVSSTIKRLMADMKQQSRRA